MTDSPISERLAKRIARAGICSRRDAEKLIEAGQVRVDGKTVLTPAINVTPAQRVQVRGKDIGTAEASRLWLYHKPPGLVTTHRDPEGRPTVFETLPEELPRVVSVGRLDLNSEGLLLLTNDGGVARQLELPSNGWRRRYRVRAFGQLPEDASMQLLQGVTVDGVRYGRVELAVERRQGDNCWASVTLLEGKNREIRKLFEHFGCQVSRLIRVSYGPFQLGKLERGQVKEVPEHALKASLKK